MPGFYANITLKGPAAPDVAAYLKEVGAVAYVSSAFRGALVVFHEDLSRQEALAADLSARFACPALLVMGFGETVLLYHLYQSGQKADAYVSSPHGDLDLDGDAPPGNAGILCAAFDAARFERRVEAILRREGKPGHPYAYAANRHGELTQALGIPTFAAAAGFEAIELGETPMGNGFELTELMKIG
ncbi:MAG TPA: hypothetical protein VG326_02005 [Tepidisphaeraceae bacterium]|jgi:hypothetical protein|nr:hypothetical protein [Tepidisphaeraceae bacterium]